MKRVDYSLLTEKKCSKCRETKAVSEFNQFADESAPVNGWRYYSWCRDCSKQQSRRYGSENRPRRNERLRQWRKENPEAASAKDKRARLFLKYRLDEKQVQGISERQEHRCAVCRNETKLIIDHDHVTGKVRGLVCYRCNIGLGWFDTFQHDAQFHKRVGAYLAMANGSW